MKYAPFTARLVAGLIDSQLINLLTLGFFALNLAAVKNLPDLVSLSLATLALAIWLGGLNALYQAWFTSHYGGGVGKLLLGLRVVNAKEEKLTFKQAFFRYTVGYTVSGMAFGLGYWWILGNEKKQAWHDMLLDDFVIQTDTSTGRLSLGVFLAILLLGLNLVLVLGILGMLMSNSPLQGELTESSKMVQELLKSTDKPSSIEKSPLLQD